ncbi:MAG: hypothetical protein IJ927_06690, partial [Eubacterium sp.]|nr:hypothetical protein [Eubacterium sp.]
SQFCPVHFLQRQGKAMKQGWRLTRRFNAVFVKNGRAKPYLVRIPNAYAQCIELLVDTEVNSIHALVQFMNEVQIMP